MIDKESLNSATTQSHDVHVQTLDAREDVLMSRIHAWADQYCEDIHKKEIERSRKKVIEINHFLDIQRAEFEDFTSFQLEIPGSETVSHTSAAESTHEEEEEQQVSPTEGKAATQAAQAKETPATAAEEETVAEEEKPPAEDQEKQVEDAA